VRISEGVDGVSHKAPKVVEFPETPPKTSPQNSNSKSKNKSKPSEVPRFLDFTGKYGKGGGENIPTASEIYRQTLEWVVSTGCERFVMPQLIEDFAMTRRSYLESEFMNKKLGRVMKDGKPSPYVKAAIEYLKQMTALYREIWAIVAQNSTTDYTKNGSNAFLESLKNRGF